MDEKEVLWERAESGVYGLDVEGDVEADVVDVVSGVEGPPRLRGW